MNRSEFLNFLTGDGRVFLVKKPQSKEENIDLKNQVDAAASKLGLPVYNLSPDEISKPGLMTLLAPHQSKGVPVETGAGSRYRMICRGVSNLKYGLVYLYNAHTMSGASVQLMSQLIRFVEQEQLNWRFVLVAHDQHKNFARLKSLGIDQYYPADIAPKRLRVAKRLTREKGLTREQRWNSRWKVGAILALGCIICSIAGLYYFGGWERNSTVSLLDSPRSAQLKVDSDITDELSSFDRDLQTYLSELEQKQQSFEDDLLRIKGTRTSARTQPSSRDSASLETSASEKMKEQTENPVARKESVKIRPPKTRISQEVLSVIARGEVDRAKELLGSGRNFLGRGLNGESALIVAAMSKQDQMMSWLIENGISTEYVDDYGRTALYYSSIQGDRKMVEILVSAGANIDARSDLDKTPLMASVHNGHLETTRQLLKSGAQPDLQDHSGWSALFYAVWGGRDDLIQLLKSAGASSDLTDKDGYSLEQVAQMRPK